jgi:hypothetical protein
MNRRISDDIGELEHWDPCGRPGHYYGYCETYLRYFRMTASIMTNQQVAGETGQARRRDWLVLLFWVVVIALVAGAVVMRLYGLGLPFDRDGYDEGVYWQSLRAMQAGYGLYSAIFYSQPPFFLLSTFPTFALLGGTLWSARLGIALVSLIGLPGAFLLGRALGGRAGALAALLLVIVNPLYLAQSQTIEAEVSSAAFELLAIGLALYWWKYPLGRRGVMLGILTGVATALSILCKLLGVSLLVPIVMLMVARLWVGVPGGGRGGNGGRSEGTGEDTHKGRPYISVAAGIAAFVITGAVVLLPFVGAWQSFISSVITFHTGAGGQFSQAGNTSLILMGLESLLTLAAFYGCVTAVLLRQDWRVLPLLAWFLTAVFLLWRQVPLFTHHLVSLVPPLIALAAMGFAPPAQPSQSWQSSSLAQQRAPGAQGNSRPGSGDKHGDGKRGHDDMRAQPDMVRVILTGLATVLLLLTVATSLQQDVMYYRTAQARGVDGLAQLEARVAADLRKAISPDQQVVTDAQFVAALADRNTPPWLVDTSMVRIDSGNLTLAQLESITAQPQVHAVLFFTGRFHLPPVAGFHAWVAHHFRLLYEYGAGRELWVR